MLEKIKNIYESLPKDALIFLKYIPDNILFGKKYKYYRARVTSSANIIDKNLYDILTYAKKYTAFWGDHIPNNFHVSEARYVLKELPYMQPSDLVNNLDNFISKEFNRINSYKTSTGGTGRNPTTIILSTESYSIEWAHMHYIWETLGYSRLRNLKLTLRGKSLKHGKLIEYNPLYNEIVVDTFKLQESNFPYLYNSIKDAEIDYIHAYPSLIKEFQNYLEVHHGVMPVKGVMLGSEGIALSEKKTIGNFFKCKVISWYGQSEKVILAADFECQNRFKVLTSYGYPCLYNEIDGFGEIAGTTFVNKALPLIKYRTGDYGRICESDDEIVITGLLGRWGKDFVYLNSAKKIPTTSINVHGTIQENILYYQIYQKEYGKLIIKILPRANLDISHEELLKLFEYEIHSKLREFDIKYKLIHNESEIVKSKRGKMILLVQDIEEQVDGQ